MTRIAYLDCVGGLAGDMLLGGLLDAGAPLEALTDAVASFGLGDEARIETERVRRAGVAATQVHVVMTDPDAPPGRRAGVLLDLVRAAPLPARAKTRALDALERLAAVEAGVHGAEPAKVFLHELGGLDTLIDICGAFVLLDALGIDRVVCSPLPYARGVAQIAHGAIPTPGPATLELLKGAPLVGVEAEGEFVTPTGAAIAAVAVDAWGELPPLTLEAVGYGAGSRDLPGRPNVLRLLLGTAGDIGASAEVVLLEANLDDLLPELIPDAAERCVVAGALDVWTAPVQMKKGRPGIVLSALARPRDERAVAHALLEHTSTLGVRVSTLRRHELDRRTEEVWVEGGRIRIKVGLLEGRVVNVAPEHDDCAAVAARTGRPVKQIWAGALAAATEQIREVRDAAG